MIFVADGRPAAILAVADREKETAGEVVRALGSAGRDVIMITGDNERTAKAVAGRLGARKLQARYASTTNVRLANALVRLALDPNAENGIFESEELE